MYKSIADQYMEDFRNFNHGRDMKDYICTVDDIKDCIIKALEDDLNHHRKANNYRNIELSNNHFYKFVRSFDSAGNIEEKYKLCDANYDYISSSLVTDYSSCSGSRLFKEYRSLFSDKEIIQLINKYINTSDMVKLFQLEFRRLCGHSKKEIYIRTNLVREKIFLYLFHSTFKSDLLKYLPKYARPMCKWSDILAIIDNIKYFNNSNEHLVDLFYVLPKELKDDPDEFNNIVYILKHCYVHIDTIVSICTSLPDKSILPNVLKIALNPVPSHKYIKLLETKLKEVPNEFKDTPEKIMQIMRDTNCIDSKLMKSVFDYAIKKSLPFDKTMEVITLMKSMDQRISVYRISFKNVDSKKYISVIDVDFTIAGIYSGRVDANKFCNENKEDIVKYILIKIETSSKYNTRLKNRVIAPLQFYRISDMRVSPKTGDCQIKLDLKDIDSKTT